MLPRWLIYAGIIVFFALGMIMVLALRNKGDLVVEKQVPFMSWLPKKQGSTPQPTEETVNGDYAFPHLAVAENNLVGYRFMYPEGYTLHYDSDGVTISLPSGKGGVRATVKKDRSLEIMVDAASVKDNEMYILKDIAYLFSATSGTCF